MSLCNRYITQAYLQITKPLEHPVYIQPPAEMNFPDDVVLRVLRPLCGIPESGLHWYLTYLEYHLECSGMQRSTVDPSVLYRRGKGLLELIVLQVDYFLMLATDEFLWM